MARYKTHVTFNLLLGYPLGAFVFYHYYSSSHPLFALFSSSFLLSTLFLNPDLDIANSIKLFSTRGLLTLPFRPYSYVFSHRGISHFPIIGTITRLGYIALIGLLIYSVFLGEIPSLESLGLLYSQYRAVLFIAVIGFMYADLCHIILDGKRKKK